MNVRSTSPPREGELGVATRHDAAFTLVETMVTLVLLGVLIVSGFGGLFTMDLCSRRTADYTAAMAVVEAKVDDIVAATYNPPNANFGTTTIYLTNSDSISLNQAGTAFRVPGVVISQIKPVASGHLITVTGTFSEPRRTITVSLQTVVNKFSTGQQ